VSANSKTNYIPVIQSVKGELQPVGILFVLRRMNPVSSESPLPSVAALNDP
jgi:hypothetical protein